MDQFKGKTAFVTGGASGIGLGLCRAYASALANGLDPACVAELVCEAIEARRLYVFTHADRRADVERRFELMMHGFDALSEKTSEPSRAEAIRSGRS
jgi:NAD(P)-dependent dehydrogenase (short-subunit alcohol dehydrogenase family)